MGPYEELRVENLMTRDPEACFPMETCADAGRIMRRRNCGFVPIIDNPHDRRVIGVVTDRDIALGLVEQDGLPSQVLLEMCMSSWPRTISPEATLQEAARLMESAAVHRLPVVKEGRLVGVLSLKDIAAFASQAGGLLKPNVAEEEVAEIVEAISVA